MHYRDDLDGHCDNAAAQHDARNHDKHRQANVE